MDVIVAMVILYYIVRRDMADTDAKKRKVAEDTYTGMAIAIGVCIVLLDVAVVLALLGVVIWLPDSMLPQIVWPW